MKTRVITAVVGLAVLAVVLAFFDTIVFDFVLSAICLLAIHEVFSAMGFGKKQWYLYAAAVPFTLLVMLTSSQSVRALILPFCFFAGAVSQCVPDCPRADIGFRQAFGLRVLLRGHRVLLLLADPPQALPALCAVSL